MRRNLARFAAASAMAITVLAASCPSAAGDLSIAIAPSVDNPADPQMGDHLVFETRLTNTGATPVLGVISWLSIVRVDPGQEAPIGLEDWSAEKAVTRASLAPGETIATDWPMRLIQDGHYRAVVSAASRDGTILAASPFADFTVRVKPVVQSARVIPVAAGVPLLLMLLFFMRRRASSSR
ncbi:hypothetical protein [Albidovulum sp.]|uniref:hypothetical protein n=1 Tax=Albidovulum sp. TaxID=1872424 RepID=UPI00352787D6